MEPEDDKNIGELILDNSTYGILNTTRDYGDYAVTNGGVSYNPYLSTSSYGPYGAENNMIKNNKGEMVFPEVLFKIINKSIPGILSIDIDSCQKDVRFNSEVFQPVPHYTVNLNVKFDYNATHIISAKKLEDKINISFPMMYPNIKFVKFSVKSISINERDYEKEFYDIFLKKK